MSSMRKKKKISAHDITLDAIVYLILVIVLLVSLYPIWYVIICSFSNSTDIVRQTGLYLWPEHFNMDAYAKVFQNQLILSGFKNTLIILAWSLPINMILTIFCGYFMAGRRMMWKKPIVFIMLFTMYFGGGMIPTYLNIIDLGLLDSIWALILPGVSIYNSIICKTAIEAIPESLSESAYIDGANDFQILYKIIVPLIKPTLAVLLLYYMVGQWNSWFSASIYLKSDDKLPLQNVLRYILMANSGNNLGDEYNEYAETIKYAVIVVSSLPIMCVYPFLQKYFTKGVMIGAVKG